MAHRWVVGVTLMVPLGCASPAHDAPMVRPGIEVLVSDSAHLVSGRRVGLLTNHTGIDRRGVSGVERLLERGVTLTAIFSPEHGYRGVLDEENIGHGVDSATGVTVWSLYGRTRGPTADMLDSVDVIVVDLQDIGARTYTYISTALLTMRAAARHGRPVIILDRPNPIGGVQVEGPVLDTAFSSFVGMLPVPLRHGMTFGELVRFGNAVLGIGADLTVVPVDGWRRSQWFDATGLPWVRPSPSMPDLESATHYPGTVLFEGTNLSVGRGTPVAFQVVGAPWLDPVQIIGAMGPVDGATLSDTTVTPVEPPDGKFGGVALRAVRLRVTDRARYDPVRTAVRLLAAVGNVHAGRLEFRAEHFDRLAGGPGLREALSRGAALASLFAAWAAAEGRFVEVRRAYLLYTP